MDRTSRVFELSAELGDDQSPTFYSAGSVFVICFLWLLKSVNNLSHSRFITAGYMFSSLHSQWSALCPAAHRASD